MKAKIMKKKEEILKEAYLDIMYTTKNFKEILENVYEYGFANGFKQGNDNAREVAEFEKKKKALQNLNMTREEAINLVVYEVGKGTTICGQDYKCKKDYKEGNCWYIKDVIYHCNRDGFLIDQNGVSWSCTPEWFNEYIYTNSELADKEKNDFVSGQFLQCKLSFDGFKEGEHYWLEYVGNDMYVGRSDNILNQKFHITPRQLFTLFSQELEEVQGPPQEEKQVSLTHEPPFNENPSDREIIEALIHHLNEQDGFLTAINCISTNAILSWLKKQKEQKPESCDCSRDEESYTNGIHHVLMNPEAYGLIKQKPTEWSEGDEYMLKMIISDYEMASKSFCGHQGKLNWLKSLSERFILEPDKQNQEVNLDHFKSYMLQYLQDAANRKDDSEIEKDTDIWAKKLLNLINIDI